MNISSGRRIRIALVGATLALSSVVTTVAPVLADPPNAIISNGTVQLGVWAEGHLNVPGGEPSSGGTIPVGLRYMPTGAESTAPGCLCEGWGAADATTGVTGYANVSSDGGVHNLSVVSFTTTASTAVSVVDILDGEKLPVLHVTHDYHPSDATPNLYEVTVTIKNVSDAPVDARYRRVMDWDIEPTAFDEFVTIQRGSATALLYSSNDGFASANPLSGPSEIGVENADVVDIGPDDHGSLFDFGFGTLAPDASATFRIFYGAAGNESDALAALAAVGAEAYSFGQPNVDGGPTLGIPNTFIFAFAGIGGRPIVGDTGLRAPSLAIDKTYTGNTGGTVGGVKVSNTGDVLTFTLGYTLVNPPVTAGVITDTLPVGLDYVGGSATGNPFFTFAGYDAGTRTLSWTAPVVTASGSVTYQTIVSATGSQTIDNVTLIDSAQTTPDDGKDTVHLQQVLAETGRPVITLPPTDSIHNGDQSSSNPGLGLMLALFVIAGIGLVAGLIVPKTSRLRREEARRR